ncbi:Exosome complex component RRP43-like protein [Drosera capensis]
MGQSNQTGDLSAEMEVDAYRRLFPLQFYEQCLAKSIRPDARQLNKARDATLALGAVASADGSALAKIGGTSMLAAVKMEVMSPTVESPDEGNIAIEFHMPPICSPLVRPGRPAEAAPVISKHSGSVDLKELCLVRGKAAWMVYLDIYCLNADGALFDAALLSAVGALSHLQIPVVSLNDEGRVVIVSEDKKEGKLETEPINKGKGKLNLTNIPFSLTCILHKNLVLPDPTADEESLIETSLTVVLNSAGQLVSFYKPGGPVLAYESAAWNCIALTRQRVEELQGTLNEAISAMEID